MPASGLNKCIHVKLFLKTVEQYRVIKLHTYTIKPEYKLHYCILGENEWGRHGTGCDLTQIKCVYWGV